MNRDMKTHVRVHLGVFTHMWIRDSLSLGAEWLQVTYIFYHLSLSKNYDCLSFFITKKTHRVSFAKTTVNDESVLRAGPGESHSHVLHNGRGIHRLLCGEVKMHQKELADSTCQINRR